MTLTFSEQSKSQRVEARARREAAAAIRARATHLTLERGTIGNVSKWDVVERLRALAKELETDAS